MIQKKKINVTNEQASLFRFSTIAMYGYCYEYIEPKYGDKSKLCYPDIDSFVVHLKSEDVHKDSAGGVEKRFDASNYKVSRPLPMGKKQKTDWVHE